jgi:hypothetical protein
MQESHKQGVAHQLDPQSCAGGRKVAGEALAGAHAGQPLSSEITLIGVPTLCCEGEGHTATGVKREPGADAAESQTLSMRGNSMRENRETPGMPSAVPHGQGRLEKALAVRPACTFV